MLHISGLPDRNCKLKICIVAPRYPQKYQNTMQLGRQTVKTTNSLYHVPFETWYSSECYMYSHVYTTNLKQFAVNLGIIFMYHSWQENVGNLHIKQIWLQTAEILSIYKGKCLQNKKLYAEFRPMPGS